MFYKVQSINDIYIYMYIFIYIYIEREREGENERETKRSGNTKIILWQVVPVNVGFLVSKTYV